jgi:serine protease Do
MAQKNISVLGRTLGATPAYAQTSGAGPTLADIAERSVPSVVNISTTRVVQGVQTHPFLDDPMLREFFGAPRTPQRPQAQRAHSLGSGVIVSKEGIVLTNNHVVERAEDIQVVLSDGKEFSAEVVGTDPQSDLAVVRLKGDLSGLQPLPIGDSSSLRLGDMVLAIGNPFGVGQTVTMGIVSATGRNRMGIVDYEDFIQTDAAINPGNSGGALVNMRGELVGINTAILSRTGGSQGIGFAIPSDMAQPIVESLLKNGKVNRGWLGVAIQDMDKDLAAGLGLSIEHGVLISDVTEGSPAARAGVKRGDVVVKLGGKAIKSSSVFRNRIAASGPDTKVELGVIRDGKERAIPVTLGSLAKSPTSKAKVETRSGLLSGMSVTALAPQARAMYKIPDGINDGVVVTRVEPGSSAQKAGIREGDVILEINRRAVDSVATFEKLHKKADKSVLLLVSRGGNTIYLALRK